MAGEQVPFYQGILIFAGIQIPCAVGASFQNPFSDQSPPMIGNFYESPSFAPGLQVPMITVNFIVRDLTTECLAAAFLNYFFDRTNTFEHNTNIMPGGIKFWNGVKGWTLRGAKFDSLQIGFSKQSLSISARFVGANEGATPAVEAINTAPAFTAWNDAAIIPGFKVTVWPDGATNPDCAISGSLTLSNNHRPNPCMNNSQFPKSMDASQFTAGFQLTRRTSATDLVQGAKVDIIIAGTNITRTFTVWNPRWQTGNNLTIEAPEGFQQWVAQVKGRPGNLVPVSYS